MRNRLPVTVPAAPRNRSIGTATRGCDRFMGSARAPVYARESAALPHLATPRYRSAYQCRSAQVHVHVCLLR